MTRIHASDLLRWLNNSRVAAMGSDRAEVRSLSFALMGVLFYQLAEAAYFIAFISDALIYRVAELSTFPRWAVVSAFAGAASMLIPHLVALSFFPKTLSCRWPRTLASWAGMVGAVSWAILAYLSVDLDFDGVWTAYAVRASVDLWVSVIIGLSLNSQQARETQAALRQQGVCP